MSNSDDRAKKDLDLWHKWDDSGRKPYMMRPLLKQFEPFIKSRANRFAQQSQVGKATVYNEFKKRFITAIKKYDPTKAKGASLGTYAFYHFKKANSDFLSKYQDAGYTPYRRQMLVRAYKEAGVELGDTLHREPTAEEYADFMKIPVNEVKRLIKEDRGEYGMVNTFQNQADIIPNEQYEILRLLHYELNPKEKAVWEYLMGEGGKPKVDSTNAIAKALNMSPSSVSKIKQSIRKKAKEFI